MWTRSCAVAVVVFVDVAVVACSHNTSHFALVLSLCVIVGLHFSSACEYIYATSTIQINGCKKRHKSSTTISSPSSPSSATVEWNEQMKEIYGIKKKVSFRREWKKNEQKDRNHTILLVQREKSFLHKFDYYVDDIKKFQRWIFEWGILCIKYETKLGFCSRIRHYVIDKCHISQMVFICIYIQYWVIRSFSTPFSLSLSLFRSLWVYTSMSLFPFYSIWWPAHMFGMFHALHQFGHAPSSPKICHQILFLPPFPNRFINFKFRIWPKKNALHLYWL